MKIADFGTSKRLTNTALRTICGTQGYVAPELLKILPLKPKMVELEEFTYALDMWSMGCLVHELLTSQTPFRELLQETTASTEIESGFTTVGSEVDMGCFYDYCQGRTDFPTEALRSARVAKPGIDFVKRLLVADPEGRATATQALRDPWLENTEYASQWYSNLVRECSDLGIVLDLGSRYDKSLMRRIRTTDIADYIPLPGHETLTELLGRAVWKGHGSISAMLIGSPTRRAEHMSEKQFEELFEQAVEAGKLGCVKLLLSGGRDIDRHLCSGRRALEMAVTEGDIEMVKLLLEHNAGTNADHGDGKSPRVLQIAVEKQFTSIVRLLVDRGANVNKWVGARPLLLAAVDARHIKIAELLLDQGADVNASANDRTSVQTAANRGDLNMVRLLLGHNCGVNSKPPGKNGLTALQGAAQGGHIEIVKLLLANNADVNASPSVNGWTALQAAADRGHIAIVKLLLEHMADIDAKSSSKGLMALHAAAKAGHIGIVELLLENKADVNAGPPLAASGTALQVATEESHIDIVKLLLAAGANVNAPPAGPNQLTAMEVAVQNKCVELVVLFLAHNANILARGFNRSVFEIASGKEYKEIAKLLSDHVAAANARSMEELGLYADVVLSAIVFLDKTSDVKTMLPNAKRSIALPPGPEKYRIRKALAHAKGRPYWDAPWMTLVTLHLSESVARLLKVRSQRERSDYTNWAVVSQRTLISTVISLLMTQGALAKPASPKYTAWYFFYLEPFLVFWVQRILYFGRYQTWRTILASPIGVILVRLMFINRTVKSFDDPSVMATLAGPVAEFIGDLLFPNWGTESLWTSNYIRERGLQQIINLGYRSFQKTMATRRLRLPRPQTGKNFI